MGSSTGAVKQETFKMEQSAWVRFEEENKEQLDLVLPLLLPLLHRVDVDGEENGRLHSSSGRGAVLSAPQRQVRRLAGPARHLGQPWLEQPHTQWDTREPTTVNFFFFCDDKLRCSSTGRLFDQPTLEPTLRKIFNAWKYFGSLLLHRQLNPVKMLRLDDVKRDFTIHFSLKRSSR